MLETEILVLGAGPAGATAALNLAPTRSVLLVDARMSAEPRIGESVPPVLNRLLADMGLLEEFRSQGHTPCHGNRSTWGSDVSGEVDFLRDPDGPGWHIDRKGFENWLRKTAIERGAMCLAPAELKTIKRDGSRWRIVLDCAGHAETVFADYVIDAGGRGSPIARRLGARRRALDRLICVWVQGTVARPEQFAGITYVEAEPDGWWYTAPLPDRRRVLAFHTDGDLPAAREARHSGDLLARAATCHELSAVLEAAGFRAEKQCGVSAAHSAVLEPCAGPGWVAIGDAAISFDPLSAQGLLNAMFTALAAAEMLDRHFHGDGNARDHYPQVIENIYEAYFRHLSTHYQAERRWRDSIFWQRRHSSTGRAAQSPRAAAIAASAGTLHLRP